MLRPLCAVMMAAALVLGAAVPASPADSAKLAQGASGANQNAKLTHDYFVGEWTTRNLEFGQDVEIIWTLWRDGTLAYRFTVDGVASAGSPGTWHFDGKIMHEHWDRHDGSKGLGRGFVAWIDENTLRLTVVDNGDPRYQGLSRVYRRTPPPKISQRP